MVSEGHTATLVAATLAISRSSLYYQKRPRGSRACEPALSSQHAKRITQVLFQFVPTLPGSKVLALLQRVFHAAKIDHRASPRFAWFHSSLQVHFREPFNVLAHLFLEAVRTLASEHKANTRHPLVQHVTHYPRLWAKH
jgi:hypothetical protein